MGLYKHRLEAGSVTSLHEPAIFARAEGGMFLFGSKAQRSEPCRKESMPFSSLCADLTPQARKSCYDTKFLYTARV